MRNFITAYLMTLICDKDIVFESNSYKYGSGDGSVVKIFGKLRSGLADMSITRLRPDGTAISSIPVFGMPINKEVINSLADLAVNSL